MGNKLQKIGEKNQEKTWTKNNMAKKPTPKRKGKKVRTKR